MSVIIGQKILHYPKVNSTNETMASLLAEERPPEGTVITADEQENGKGYQGNYWESDPGKNLTFSLLLYPEVVPPEEVFSLSKAVALGIAEYLSTIFREVKVKWPNDVYIQDDKIAGILIENSLTGNKIDYSIIGIGLNVNQTVFYSDAPNPTSMKLRAARHFALEEVLPAVLTFIENRYLQLFTEFSEYLSRDYIKRLYRYNQFFPYKSGQQTFIARIIQVDNQGNIILQKQDGEKLRFGFKEVAFL